MPHNKSLQWTFEMPLNSGVRAEMKPILTTQEHYDFLAQSGHGNDDPPWRDEYMARWDGPAFFEIVGDVAGKSVLEIGVGNGRLARHIVDGGCSRFVGIDISRATLDSARTTLGDSATIELIQTDICDFSQRNAFDIAFSVLTFEHIEHKRVALANAVGSLRPGGRFVLSVNLEEYFDEEGQPCWLDFGSHKVRLFPAKPRQYVSWLEDLGCRIDRWLDVRDTFVPPNGNKSKTYGQTVAALIRATNGLLRR